MCKLLLILLLSCCTCCYALPTPALVANDTNEHDNGSSIVVITDAEIREALIYLRKFGYLQLSSGDDGSNNVTDGDLSEAVAKFQAVYQLPVTRQLNPATLTAMREARCGVADNDASLPTSLLPRTRPKRSVLNREQLADKPKLFPSRNVTWHLGSVSRLDRHVVFSLLRRAFDLWSEVSPLTFWPVTDAKYPADIRIGFFAKNHESCSHDFDGPGGDAAHTQAATSIHIDSEEVFQLIEQGPTLGRQVHLLRLFVHEIGHLLGLRHSAHRSSIMHPSGVSLPAAARAASARPLIGQDEIRLVRDRYGPCSPRIDAIVDWRSQPQQLVPRTHIVSCTSVWTRNLSGGPRRLDFRWRGLDGLNRVDAIIQAQTPDSRQLLSLAFSGSKYFVLDSRTGRLIDKPANIAADFSGRGQGRQFPSQIDAAYFDQSKRRAVFIARDWAFEYDLMHPNGTLRKHNCCDRRLKLSQMFPQSPQPAFSQQPLPSRLDAAYYRLSDSSVFLISGTDFWRYGAVNQTDSSQDFIFEFEHPNNATVGDPMAPTVDYPEQSRALSYGGKVFDQWKNLCSVADAKCDLNRRVKRQ